MPAVPRKDKDYKSLYDEVGDFIEAGERFCEEVRRFASVSVCFGVSRCVSGMVCVCVCIGVMYDVCICTGGFGAFIQ